MISIIVIYVCIVHYIYAAALIIEPSAVGITAINSVVWLMLQSRIGAAGLFLAVASLAIVGLSSAEAAGVLLLAPQQATLIVSAAGAINAMVSGQFADGITRPYWFLIADQSPVVVAAVCHTVALLRMRRTS